MTDHASTAAAAHPLAAGKLPPRGKQLIIRNVYLGGQFTPASGGGLYATYHGMINGAMVFEGRTADRGFLTRATAAGACATWEMA